MQSGELNADQTTGMGNMNSGLEEIYGNKLELAIPLVDSFLLEIPDDLLSPPKFVLGNE